ncbi:MAG: GTP cyclohydrolase II [Burkholderiaceae bacterium]|nr:GTP cyclohydrolase II [Burkholderiaceae bacterium]
MDGSGIVEQAQQQVRVRTRVVTALERAGGAQAALVTFDGPVITDSIAIDFGRGADGGAPWVRVHSSCLTGDLFGSCRCDCGPQLDRAITHLRWHGGVLIYLPQEGRGIGLKAKIDAYALQDAGHDTFEANRLLGLPEDARRYDSAARMLHALGQPRIRLLSANPDKRAQLSRHGIDVVDMQALHIAPGEHNAAYLEAKRRWFAELRGLQSQAPDTSTEAP